MVKIIVIFLNKRMVSLPWSYPTLKFFCNFGLIFYRAAVRKLIPALCFHENE